MSKRLTDYIVDVGRPVAYYPNLKKLTGSTTATIFLCQLLYWSDKTNDGWIWKDSNDIEEETGLTYNEQRTARRTLVESGLVEEEFKRLEHQIKFRVNQEELNTMWEECGGKKTKQIPPKDNKAKQPEQKKEKPANDLSSEDLKKLLEEAEERQKKTAEKKKNNSSEWIAKATGNTPESEKALQKTRKKKEIKEAIEKKLSLIADNQRWEKFIDFVYVREEEHNEPVDVFLTWALREGFDPLYWTPEKLKTMYPRAFVEKESNKPREDFIKNLPKKKEEVYAPMPDEAKIKRDLF